MERSLNFQINEKMKRYILNIFNYLHTHAEISLKEYQTTQFIEKELLNLGYKVNKFNDCTGLVAEIGDGKPIVALRADIDALWQEVNGNYQANHSCGHDAHMSMVLGVAMLLKRNQANLPHGTIRLLFQPAEEIGKGAVIFCEKGVVADADYLFGIHLRPKEEVKGGKATPAILHGACNSCKGLIIGEESHAARWHLGVNPIEVGAIITNRLAMIHIDPTISYSIKMTSFHAGQARNIIPGKAEFTLDLRARTDEVMQKLILETQEICKNIAECFRAKISLAFALGSPAARSDPEAIDIMKQAICQILGKDNYEVPYVSNGSDDFHQYNVYYPKLKSTMLGLGCNLEPGLHHPNMTFDREAIFPGISILTTAIVLTMKRAVNN